jgi:hypothetical protein
MKFEKMDPKKAPKLIMVSVLAVGLLGYLGYSFFGASGPKPAAAAAPGAPTGKNGAEANDDADVPNTVLAPVYRADPFQPAIKRAGLAGGILSAPPARPTGSASSGGAQVEVGTMPLGPAMLAGSEAVGSNTPAPFNPGKAAPSIGRKADVTPAKPVEVAPVRPDVVVTGIVGSSDAQFALVELGAEKLVVKLGEIVGNGYRLAKIETNGVWLANRKDEYFVVLGERPKSSTAPAAASPVPKADS